MVSSKPLCLLVFVGCIVAIITAFKRGDVGEFYVFIVMAIVVMAIFMTTFYYEI